MLDFVALIKGVVLPTLGYMDVSSEVFHGILHLHPTFDSKSGSWMLRNLSITSSKASEERLIIRPYYATYLNKILGQNSNHLSYLFPFQVKKME